MLKIAVMVSGGGTNLQAIIDSISSGYLKDCTISTVISSKDGVYALERAKNNDISSVVISRKKFESFDQYEDALINHLSQYDIDLIVLAGFLSMLGKKVVNKYEGKIINVHPSLIPSFCGKGFYGIIPHEKAIEYGVKVTGATVHFVDENYDTGPVILQKAVYIKDDDTPQVLQKRVMKEAEWVILSEAIKLFSEGRLEVEGRKVRIKPI